MQKKEITPSSHSVRISYHGMRQETVVVEGLPEPAMRNFYSLGEPEINSPPAPVTLTSSRQQKSPWENGVLELMRFQPLIRRIPANEGWSVGIKW